MLETFPFRPGDWVTNDGDDVAKVKAVYEGEANQVLLDLVLYSHGGLKIGRQTPAMGGPKTFEPACAASWWQRIKQPVFPIKLKWVEDGSGHTVARFWTGERLPPASYKPPKPRIGKSIQPWLDDMNLRRALQQIADGHNDPRALATEVLRRKP